MADALILVRHAKTEPRSEDYADITRELTPTGVRSAKAALPRVASLICATRDAKEVRIWSSPAVRAQQTARILASALGKKVSDIELHENLYVGDLDEVFLEVDGTPGTVVCVGHNPFMERAFATLTGHELHFGKAAAAEIDLRGVKRKDKARNAHITWFVQGPDHRRWETLIELEHTLAQANKDISAAYWHLREAPNDPESVHQYRISLRVARSLVSFISPWQKHKQARACSNALKHLQAQTSRLREYDVLEEMLRDEGPTSNWSDAQELLDLCERQCATERQRFLKDLSSARRKDDLRQVDAILSAVKWRDAIETRGLDVQDVRLHYLQLEQSFEKDLSACNFNDPEATHSIRKRAKQQRYVARALPTLLGEQAAKVGAQAKATQDLLGKLCDARVNRRIALELIPPLPLPGEAELFGRVNTFADAQQDTVKEILTELKDRDVSTQTSSSSSVEK